MARDINYLYVPEANKTFAFYWADRPEPEWNSVYVPADSAYQRPYVSRRARPGELSTEGMTAG